jgi:hypothetical protein
MDFNAIVQTILGGGLLAMGWFARELWAAVQMLKADLAKFQVDVGSNYIRYDRLQDALKPILEGLAEIKHTLSTKADKP